MEEDVLEKCKKDLIQRKYEDTLMRVERRRNVKEIEPSEMTPRDYKILREIFDIKVLPKTGPLLNPIRTWEESQISRDVLKKVKFDTPTPVQMQVIPYILDQRNIIVVSQTGSGKTLSFVLPYAEILSNVPESDDPRLLVLVPTRELCIQIVDEFDKFTDLRTLGLIGGKNIDEQRMAIGMGIDVLVSTPGRLKEAIELSFVILCHCKFFVVDEMDRLLSDGFEEDFFFIYDSLPKKKVVNILSATYNKNLGKIEKVENFDKIFISDVNAVNVNVDENFTFIKGKSQTIEKQKDRHLKTIFGDHQGLIMVFCITIRQCERVVKKFSRSSLLLLHGRKLMDQREGVIRQFREGCNEILVCTDVAGRGVDIDGVALVVNYDLPPNIETYIHRVGRTGRMSKGKSISLLCEHESHLFLTRSKMLRDNGKDCPPFLERGDPNCYD